MHWFFCPVTIASTHPLACHFLPNSTLHFLGYLYSELVESLSSSSTDSLFTKAACDVPILPILPSSGDLIDDADLIDFITHPSDFRWLHLLGREGEVAHPVT